ncbi:MAG: hypothetical protein Q9193_005958 [Seirophora villosa]
MRVAKEGLPIRQGARPGRKPRIDPILPSTRHALPAIQHIPPPPSRASPPRPRVTQPTTMSKKMGKRIQKYFVRERKAIFIVPDDGPAIRLSTSNRPAAARQAASPFVQVCIYAYHSAYGAIGSALWNLLAWCTTTVEAQHNETRATRDG